MRLRHLRYFVGIVDAGSFSRAAECIHVAQPALSQQIAELERDLGVALLVRSVRGVQPTPAGKALYAEAQSILQRIEQLSSVIRGEETEPEGTVNVGMSSSFAAYVVGPLLMATRARYPRIKLSLTATDSDVVRSAVIEGRLDLGLIFEDKPSNSHEALRLFRHRLYCVATPDADDADDTHPISLAMLAQRPLVLPQRSNVTLHVLKRAFAESQLTPHVVTEVDQLPTMLSAVARGVGVAVMPRADHTFPQLYGPISARLIEPPLLLTSAIIWPKRGGLQRAAAGVREVLVDFLRDHLGSQQVEGIEAV